MRNFQDARYEELLREVRTLSSCIQTLQNNFERLADNQDLMMEANPSAPNLWLTPKQLGQLVGLSSSTISKYRKRDIFKKFSVKEVEKGQYVYYYYHRQNALKDLQKIKPVHIRSNSIYISDKV
jgi:hypothetical protein|tara:strand:+ start:152 stop:523 length:372 start_codon:yes stop_codon:yes gene_type:complete